MDNKTTKTDRILTQEEFDGYLLKLKESDNPTFAKMAGDIISYHPTMQSDGTFVLDVPNSYIEAEVRGYKVSLLTLLRDMSGSRCLNCTINVVHVEQEEVAYKPEDKFKVMAGRNPKMVDLRQLFPNIDY